MCEREAHASPCNPFASAIAFDPGLVSVRGPDWPDPHDTKGQVMSIKLSDTQLAMMRAAAQRDDRCLTPSPTLKDAAAQKLATKLIAANLAREIKAKAGTPVWRRDAEGGPPFALKLTAAGLKVAAVNEETAAAIESEGRASPEAIVESTSFVDVAAGSKHPGDPAPREGSKLAAVVGMLRRSEGATIGDLTAATGWLPHTTRAAITGLRNRGYSVVRERMEHGSSAYRISDAPVGGSDILQSSSELPSSSETASGRRRRGAKAKQAAQATCAAEGR